MLLTSNKYPMLSNLPSNLTIRSSFINKEVDYAIRDSILCVPDYITLPKDDSDSLRDNIFNYPSPRVKDLKQRKFPQKLKLKENSKMNERSEILKKPIVKKQSIKNKNEDRSSLSLNRSFVVFEKQQYIDKNASFIKTNQHYSSEEEEAGNRSTFIKPQEIVSKQELSILINLYEPKKTGNSPKRKKNSVTAKPKNKASFNTNLDITNEKKDEFRKCNTNIIRTNFGNDGIYSNNFNKFATKSWIDDAFDSPREKEFKNLENFEEENELSNFNFTCPKDGLNNLLAISNNFPLKEKKSYALDDDEDFIFDGRNRHVFSFYNKNNEEKVKQSNLKKNNYTIVKSDIETISEHPHENVLNMSYNNNNLSYLDGKNEIKPKWSGNNQNNSLNKNSQNNFVIEKNSFENMNTNCNQSNFNSNFYKNNTDLKVITVNNFELENNHKKIDFVFYPQISKQVEKVDCDKNLKKVNQITKIENVSNVEVNQNLSDRNITNDANEEIAFDIKSLNLNLIEKKKSHAMGNKVNLEGFLLRNKNPCGNNNNNCNNLNQNSNLAQTNNPSIKIDSVQDKKINLQNKLDTLNQLNTHDKATKFESNYNNIITKENQIKNENEFKTKNNSELKQQITNKINLVNSNSNSATSSKSSNFYSTENNKKVKLIDSIEKNIEHESNLPVQKTKNFTSKEDSIKSKPCNSVEFDTNKYSHKINELYNLKTKQTDINTCTFSNELLNNFSSNYTDKTKDQTNNFIAKPNIPIPLPYQPSSISSTKKPPLSSGVSISRHSFSQNCEDDFSYSTLYKKKANQKTNEMTDSHNKSHNKRADSTASRRTNYQETTQNENLNSKNFHNLNDIYERKSSEKNFDTKNKTQTQILKTGQTPQYQQFVVLQKHLPYSKYNLDLLPKTKAHDEKEVLYNNVADYQTLNQLINSVKKAYNNQMMQFKKTQNNKFHITGNVNVIGTYRSTSPVSRSDKLKFNERKLEKYEYKSHHNTNPNSFHSQLYKIPNSSFNSVPNNTIKKKFNRNIVSTNQNLITSHSHPASATIKKEEKDFENFLPDAIDENTLVELLEEIKERSNKIQTHFKLKEENMNNQIKELNENIKTFQEKEKNLREEIEVWKSKLAFFIEDFRTKSNENKIEANNRTNLFSHTTKSNDEFKSEKINLNTNEEILKEALESKKKFQSNNEKIIQNLPLDNLNLNDLPKIVSEKTFSQKYDLPKLKSFVLILKEVGLDMTTFYDQISLNELEDDICQECFVNPVNKKKANWNFSEDSTNSNRKIC